MPAGTSHLLRIHGNIAAACALNMKQRACSTTRPALGPCTYLHAGLGVGCWLLDAPQLLLACIRVLLHHAVRPRALRTTGSTLPMCPVHTLWPEAELHSTGNRVSPQPVTPAQQDTF